MKMEAEVHEGVSGWWYEAARKNIPLSEYFELYRDKMIDNDQVRRVSGVDFDYGDCTEDHLEIAKTNLRENFEFVGITEQFDESIIAMKRFLSWQTKPFYLLEKVSTYDINIVHSDSALNEIRIQNYYDIDLYDYAGVLFMRKVEEYGQDLAKHVRNFKAQNRQMSRLLAILLPLYRSYRKLAGRGRLSVFVNL